MGGNRDEAGILKERWNSNAGTIEGAMHAILYGVRDPKTFDDEGAKQAQYLIPLLPPDAAVMELGCGIGRILKHLSPHCRELYGIDISPKMLAFAREWLAGCGNVKLLEGNGRDLDVLGDGTIDFAYSLLVLQHMDKNDAYVYLKELFRVLRDGGTALLNFPNILSESFLRDFAYVSLIPQEERDVEKVRSYTKEEVEKIVASVGFRIEEIRADEYIWVRLKKDPGIFPSSLIMKRTDTEVLGIQGWYWLEENGGYRYRWTRKRATFQLKVPPGRRRLSVILCSADPEVDSKGIEIALSVPRGGRETVTLRGSHWQEISFPLPLSESEGIFPFALEVERTWCPHRALGRGETRDLGVAVSGMRVA